MRSIIFIYTIPYFKQTFSLQFRGLIKKYFRLKTWHTFGRTESVSSIFSEMNKLNGNMSSLIQWTLIFFRNICY